MLPKPFPGGLLYQETDSNAIKLVSPCPDDGSVDTSLSFLPHYERLELVDCCNGLVLCKYGSSSSLPDISHHIVCNPVTRQWAALPESQQEQDGFHYVAKLAFDPSWSQNFYIFNFHEKCSPNGGITGVCSVGIFSSEYSTWSLDEGWTPENEISITCRQHFFLRGVLYVQTADDQVLEIEPFHQMELSNHRFIELPGYKPSSPFDDFLYGCLGQLSGVLHYAQPEIDGCTIQIWGLEHGSWNMKHRISMSDAFGRNVFIQLDTGGFWCCDYDIQIVDLERGIIFLRDCCANKLLSYNMSTGRLSEIRQGFNRYMSYVSCYSMFRIEQVGTDKDISEE